MVLTTHDLAHVEKAATEVALIRSGRVIAHGSPSELTAGRSEIEVEVRGAGLTGELCAALQRDGLVLRFELAGENAARLACAPDRRRRLGVELVQRGVEIEELHTARASLEEAFLSLVQSKETGS